MIHLDGQDYSPGDVIRRVRRLSHTSQQMIVGAIQCDHNRVYAWEAGRAMPRIDRFVQAIEACGYRVVLERK